MSSISLNLCNNYTATQNCPHSLPFFNLYSGLLNGSPVTVSHSSPFESLPRFPRRITRNSLPLLPLRNLPITPTSPIPIRLFHDPLLSVDKRIERTETVFVLWTAWESCERCYTVVDYDADLRVGGVFTREYWE